MPNQRIAVDASLCHGCQTCVLSCSLYHEGECNLDLARLRVAKDMERYQFRLTICRQCESPECIPVCPTEAMRYDERGAVMLFEHECIQCGACVDACPYDAVFLSEATGRYLKCDLCAGRVEGPLCAALCPVEALSVPGEDIREV